MELFINTHYDFIGKKNFCLIGSGALILIGIVAYLVFGGLNYGIDFNGGTLVQVKFNKTVTAEELRQSLSSKNLGSYTIQQYGPDEKNEKLIRLPVTIETEIEKSPAVLVEQALKELYSDQYSIERTESVGPAIGQELKHSAFGSMLVALALILIYITFRFEFKFAVGAVVALVHDVMITMGAFALTQREINLPVIAAFLTIVGYSLNDTIVVYDRIRENVRLMSRSKFSDIINTSINQTLSRTILTSGTTLLVVVALFFFGGEVINDFAFALLIGISVGTYSSVYVAAPIVLAWGGSSSAPKRS